MQSSDTDVLLFRIREHRESDGKVVLERTLFGDAERDTDFLELLQKKIDFTPMQLYLIRKEFMVERKLKIRRRHRPRRHGIRPEDALAGKNRQGRSLVPLQLPLARKRKPHELTHQPRQSESRASSALSTCCETPVASPTARETARPSRPPGSGSTERYSTL